jgi:hypothetical protein
MMLSAFLCSHQALGQAPSCATTVKVDTVIGVAYGLLDVTPPNAIPQEYFVGFLTAVARGIGQPIVIPFTEALTGIIVEALGIVRVGGGEPYVIETPVNRQPQLPAWPGYPELTPEVEFTIRRDGTVANLRMTPNGDTTVAAMLVAALGTTQANPFPAGVGVESVQATLSLALSPSSQYTASLPLLELLALKTAATRPKMNAKSRPTLRYPNAERMAGTQATVLIWYDIGEDGKPAKNSFGAAPPLIPRHANGYEAFVATAIAGLRPLRFSPAQQGDCAIKMRAVQTVEFRLRR